MEGSTSVAGDASGVDETEVVCLPLAVKSRRGSQIRLQPSSPPRTLLRPHLPTLLPSQKELGFPGDRHPPPTSPALVLLLFYGLPGSDLGWPSSPSLLPSVPRVPASTSVLCFRPTAATLVQLQLWTLQIVSSTASPPSAFFCPASFQHKVTNVD